MAILQTSMCCIIFFLIELTAAVIGIILSNTLYSDNFGMIFSTGICLFMAGVITLIIHHFAFIYDICEAISCKKHFGEQQVENHLQTFHYLANNYRDRRTFRKSELHSHSNINQPPPAYQYSSTGFQHESMLFILLYIAGESKY